MKNDFYNLEKDGVTQGLLNKFRNCREEAWLFLQGYSQKSTTLALVYGDIIHGVLERAYTDISKKVLKAVPSQSQTKNYVRVVEKLWEKDRPRADKKTIEFKELACLIAEATLPTYFEFWRKDIKEMQWLGLETQFEYPVMFKGYPSIPIRGKMDGVYRKSGLWLFETKSKSRIEEGNLVDLLPMDFQNLLYCWYLWKKYKEIPKGIKYNIVRRTCLTQKKSESLKQYAVRIAEDIKVRPEFYFMRFEIHIDESDLIKFERELFGQLKEFMDWWNEKMAHYPNPSQCETKYGRCWALSICADKNYSLYEKRNQVFRELEDY